MAVLRCRRFPRGTVHIRTAGGVVVDFHDGRAEVHAPDLVEALLALPPVFGIVLERPPATQEPAAPDDSAAEPVPPPMHGRGSGADAWAAYAHARGVEVPDGAKAGTIRELLAEHGIPAG